MTTEIVEVQVVKSKPWWKSKTIWFNALGIVAEVALVLAKSNILTGTVVGVVVGIGNLILRKVTDSKLTAGNNKTVPQVESDIN